MIDWKAVWVEFGEDEDLRYEPAYGHPAFAPKVQRKIEELVVKHTKPDEPEEEVIVIPLVEVRFKVTDDEYPGVNIDSAHRGK